MRRFLFHPTNELAAERVEERENCSAKVETVIAA